MTLISNIQLHLYLKLIPNPLLTMYTLLNTDHLVQQQPNVLALFDLDHTLLPLDSDYVWGQFLVTVGAVDAEKFSADNQRLMDSYNQGTLTADVSLPILLAPLAAHSRDTLAAWHLQFMQDIIEPALLPAAKAVLAHHRMQGHTVLIVTATNRFVTQPIAAALGVDAQHLIATELETKNGDAQASYTGNWVGTPSFKEGKITRVNEWLKVQGLSLNDFSETWFYSDSINDIPLMSIVSHPVACNPSPALQAHALEKGWRIQRLWPA
jgi:HAD superfamily hydrolase (TIGR01490 family)